MKQFQTAVPVLLSFFFLSGSDGNLYHKIKWMSSWNLVSKSQQKGKTIYQILNQILFLNSKEYIHVADCENLGRITIHEEYSILDLKNLFYFTKLAVLYRSFVLH